MLRIQADKGFVFEFIPLAHINVGDLPCGNMFAVHLQLAVDHVNLCPDSFDVLIEFCRSEVVADVSLLILIPLYWVYRPFDVNLGPLAVDGNP